MDECGDGFSCPCALWVMKRLMRYNNDGLLDHLVGKHQQRGRNFEAQGLCRQTGNCQRGVHQTKSSSVGALVRGTISQYVSNTRKTNPKSVTLEI